ncbi:MAG: hypothetical protein Q8O76_01380, partial [Chloroflexota bacterium]|nr:hypothetical protein [Chloroflexota bacterium]
MARFTSWAKGDMGKRVVDRAGRRRAEAGVWEENNCYYTGVEVRIREGEDGTAQVAIVSYSTAGGHTTLY